MKYKSFYLSILIVFSWSVQAQTVDRDDEGFGNKIFSFQFHYTYQEPAGDLAARYGQLNNIGTGVTFKTKSHWLLAFDFSYQFGTHIKETDMFNNLTNSNGIIMNTGGYPASYTVSARGLNSFIKAGRIFPLSPLNRNSGILVMAGAGFYMHKISINSPQNDIPTLTPDLRKGYDRFTGGPAVTQFLGYYFHSKNRFVNFYIGIDAVQAFTSSYRKYNYDLMAPDTKKRLDMTYGLRFGWMIPIYLTTKEEDEFNYR